MKTTTDMQKTVLTTIMLGLLLMGCSHKQPLATGVFEAQIVSISAESNGRILKMHVQEGDTVIAGQEIALVDTLEYAYQRRTLLANRDATLSAKMDTEVQTSALQQQLATLEEEHQRVSRLLEKGAATRKQRDDLEAQIRIVRSQLSAAKAQIATSNSTYAGSADAIAVQVEGIEQMLTKCHIKSPINGVVIGKYVQEGEITAAGRPVAKVADMNNVYLRAYFTSDKLRDIKLGQAIKVRACYGGKANQEYNGKVIWIASESEFTPKSIPTNDERANLVYAVKIAVENDGYIKLGLTGEVL